MASVIDLLRLNRVQLKRLVESQGAAQMREVYATARGDLENKLAKLVRAGRGDSFTAHHYRQVLIQVHDTLHGLNRSIVETLGRNDETAATLARGHFVRTIKTLEKRYTGSTPVLQIEQAAVFRGVFKQIAPSLLDQHKRSVKFYGRPVVEKIKAQMAVSMAQNETVADVVERVAGTDGVFAEQAWMAERIGRTEMAHAYGVTKQAAMNHVITEFPDLQKKWIANFDDRMGDDSRALHGTVIPIDAMFTYTYKTKKGPRTISCLQPPIRPQDRCEAIPWRPGWAELSATKPL